MNQLTDYKRDRLSRYLAFGAIIGPIIFTIVAFSLASIRPGYSHISQLFSELGEIGAPNAIVMNTLGTPILGVSVILFSLALKQVLERTRTSQSGVLVVLIGGICLILGGLFPCDPGCIPVTFSGKMHELVSNIGFSGIILAPLLLSVHFRTSISWKKYWFPTLMVGVFTVILVPLYLTDFFVSWNGFVQRLLLANLLIWIEAVAFKIYRG